MTPTLEGEREIYVVKVQDLIKSMREREREGKTKERGGGGERERGREGWGERYYTLVDEVLEVL